MVGSSIGGFYMIFSTFVFLTWFCDIDYGDDAVLETNF